MIVELTKRDIVHLLRGVNPNHDKIRIIEKMKLGYYIGGFDDSFYWEYPKSYAWDKYSEEELYELYKELTR